MTGAGCLLNCVYEKLEVDVGEVVLNTETTSYD